MQKTLKFSLLPLLVIAALVPAREARIEQVKRACVEVEVVADKCARKHYSSYKLEHSKTQPLVKKCFSDRAHVTDLMLDCAEPMALGIFLTCSVDSVSKTSGKATHDPDFKKRTKAFKTCVEKGLQGTVPAETDPYEFDKRRKKKIRRRLADPSGEGLFNNVFPRYANDSIFLLCRLHDVGAAVCLFFLFAFMHGLGDRATGARTARSQTLCLVYKSRH